MTCRRACRPRRSRAPCPRVSLASATSALEMDLIQDALKTSSGNLARTARLLDTTERIIAYKVKKLGIDLRRFRRE